MTDPTTVAAMRFGYGLPLPQGAPTTPDAMLAALSGPDVAAKTWPGLGLAQVLGPRQNAEASRAAARALRDLADQHDAAREQYRTDLRVVNDQATRSAQVTFARAVGSPDGFRERLVAFWANHFTTVARFRLDGAMPSALVEDAIRPHVAGRFADMLRAATLHPSMITYLDQGLSIGPNSPIGLKRKRGLNENLARELIELHTIGVDGRYTQTDVRQMAELLTGVVFDASKGQVFDTKWAEPGAETVLGKTYAGDGEAPILEVLDDLAVRPETARHLAHKLAVHFVGDDPDPALVAVLAQSWEDSGGDLAAVYGALLDAPQAWDAPLTKARQPYDFLVASLRALGLGGEDMLDFADNPFKRMVLGPLKVMGQPWQTPRGPDGWPEVDTAWISPQGLAARISWAMTVPGRLVTPMPDPETFARNSLGPLAGERLLWAVERSESIREGVGLVLASPEFNRR